MPMCNSSYCKTNSYVCSVSVQSKSSGTTHTFKKENDSATCQELLLKEYFCFLFLYTPTMIHLTMGRMLMLNKPTRKTTSQNTKQ